jgi:hypothetical protein
MVLAQPRLRECRALFTRGFSPRQSDGRLSGVAARTNAAMSKFSRSAVSGAERAGPRGWAATAARAVTRFLRLTRSETWEQAARRQSLSPAGDRTILCCCRRACNEERTELQCFQSCHFQLHRGKSPRLTTDVPARVDLAIEVGEGDSQAWRVRASARVGAPTRIRRLPLRFGFRRNHDLYP